jgi:cyclomaltodextrinase
MLTQFIPTTFVGNHDTTRIASQLADQRNLTHALTVLFSVGGIPAIYAGDEQAFRGVKEDRPGGDEEVRPAFPERPEQLSRVGEPVRALHQRLIGLRRRKPWMVRGSFERLRVVSARTRRRSSAAPD